jgi:hypothetical protein
MVRVVLGQQDPKETPERGDIRERLQCINAADERRDPAVNAQMTSSTTSRKRHRIDTLEKALESAVRDALTTAKVK